MLERSRFVKVIIPFSLDFITKNADTSIDEASFSTNLAIFSTKIRILIR